MFTTGGLAANAPIEAVLQDASYGRTDLLCVVVDLFDPRGRRPATLEQATHRALDLLFANQTSRALAAFEGARTKRPEPAGRSTTVVVVRHRGLPADPGPHKMFDFSGPTVGQHEPGEQKYVRDLHSLSFANAFRPRRSQSSGEIRYCLF